MGYPTWALVVGSILTSVLLVLVSKIIFAAGFSYIFTLTTMHFIWTAGLLQIMARCCGFFEVKHRSHKEVIVVACFGVGSICLLNFSLRHNSVGFYQMLKLCVVPCCLVIDAVGYGEFPTRKISAALLLIIFGVGAATVTDLELNLVGSIFGVLAVFVSAQYQTWMGRKQKEWDMSSQELALALCTYQVFVGAVVALIVDVPQMRNNTEHLNPLEKHEQLKDLSEAALAGLILASCVLAIGANVHAFALIGKTSAVTFQVVGHGKTCLILVAYYAKHIILEGKPVSDLSTNMAGVLVALLGVVLYSNIKLTAPGERDLLDKVLPQCLLDVLEPSRPPPFIGAKTQDGLELGEAKQAKLAVPGTDEPEDTNASSHGRPHETASDERDSGEYSEEEQDEVVEERKPLMTVRSL